MLFIGTLLGASLWVLRPFVGPGIWATMVVVPTWPMMLRLQARLCGRRSLAVAVMTLLLLLLFLVPLALAVVTIVGNAGQIAEWAHALTTWRLPEAPPPWLVQLPLVGSMAESG